MSERIGYHSPCGGFVFKTDIDLIMHAEDCAVCSEALMKEIDR